MAVAVILDFAGASLEQYDQVIAKMRFTRGGPGAPGGLFHWATKSDTGVRVTDVWETREQFEAFAQQQIGPIAADAGMPEPPQITFYDVHNYLTTG